MTDDEPTERVKAKPTTRDVAVVAGRTTAGVVVAAVAAAVAFASTFIVPPTWSATAPSLVVAPTAAAQQLVCPGGLLRLATDTGEGASSLSAIGAPRTAWAADTSVDIRSMMMTNAATESTLAAPEIGTVAVGDSRVPSASGMQSEIVRSGIAGLATAACTAPASEQWLAAGATTLGRTSLLLLANPSGVEATVEIELYSETGQISAAGLRGLRLAPDEQLVVPLNGFAVDVTAPVLRVVSTGGRVSAALQQSIVRSLAPGGVELSPAQHPAHSLVIPGVRVQTKAELAPIDVAELDHDDISPVLRLFAPGSGEVEATVALVPYGATLTAALEAREEPGADADAHTHHDHDGESHEAPEPRSFDVTLTPGLVSEIAIEEVAAGDYTVVVTAAEPVVGAVRTSTLAAPATPQSAPLVDFAWATPAAPMTDREIFALPPLAAEPGTASAAGAPGSAAAPGATPAGVPPLARDGFRGYLLWVANPTASPASVTITIGARAPMVLEIAPGTAEWVELPPAATVGIDGLQGLSAAILGAGPGLLAQTPLQPPGQLASDVLIRF